METHALGAIASPIDVRDYKAAYVSAQSVQDYPEEFELWMPPVKDQGMVGSCVAHAISTVIEYFNHIQEGKDNAMSTNFIYGNRLNTQRYNEGMITRYAIENAVKYGDVDASAYPGNDEVPKVYMDFEEKAYSLIPDAVPYRLSSYYKLESPEAMKKQLMTTGPIIMTANWTGAEKVDQNGRIYGPFGAIATQGHCTVIYGWNQYGWKVQNSWGDMWGRGGRCIVPYSYPTKEVYGVSDEICEAVKDKKIQELTMLNTRLEASIREKEQQLSEVSDTFNDLYQMIDELEEQIKEYKKSDLNDLLQYKKMYYIAISRIEEYQREIEELKNTDDEAANELKERLARTEKEIAALNQTKEELSHQIEDILKNCDDEIKDWSERFDELHTDYFKVTSDFADLQGEHHSLITKYEESLKEVEDLKDQIMEIEKPFKEWPKWLIALINLILKLVRKEK